MSREKQNAEIYRPMCEEFFNNIEKQYQELAKVKAESEQIEEMTKVIDEFCQKELYAEFNDDILIRFAGHLYEKGYRKQSEGEWLEINDGVLIGDGKHLECSKCGVWKKDKQKSNFCSNCGAKMKGGAE